MSKNRPAGPKLSFMGLSFVFLIVIDLFVLGGYKEVMKAPGALRHAHLSLPSPQIFLGSEAYDYLLSEEIVEQDRIAKEKLLKQQELELTKALGTPSPDYLALSLSVPQPNSIPNQNIIEPSSGLSDVSADSDDDFDPRSKSLSSGLPVKIAVIIDDLGMSRERTNAVIDIKWPLTLAFLPYAPNLDVMTQRARTLDHDLIIHVPMEPLDKKLNPGPLALWDGMSHEAFILALDEIFDSFDGYIGINNHMGSKLTQNREMMDWLMVELRKRKLIFVDSKTISTSVAIESANAHNLYHAQRDIFLDHVDTREFVINSLKKLEETAHKKGFAIAIGHPKAHTIQAIKEWLPTLAAKNIELVPISELVRAPSLRAEDMVQAIDDLPASGTDDGFNIKLPDFGIGGSDSSL